MNGDDRMMGMLGRRARCAFKKTCVGGCVGGCVVERAGVSECESVTGHGSQNGAEIEGTHFGTKLVLLLRRYYVLCGTQRA